MKTALLAVTAALILPLHAQDRPDAPREGDGPARERIAREKEEIERHVKAALTEAEELEKAGKKEEAAARRQAAQARAKEAFANLERAAQARGREGEARKEGEPRREGGDRRPEGPSRAELENKLRHVEQAVGHLREAGMPDVAEHVNQIANRLRAGLRGEGEPRREEPRREEARREEPRRPQNDIEALRREIQELRQVVRELAEKQSR